MLPTSGPEPGCMKPKWQWWGNTRSWTGYQAIRLPQSIQCRNGFHCPRPGNGIRLRVQTPNTSRLVSICSNGYAAFINMWNEIECYFHEFCLRKHHCSAGAVYIVLPQRRKRPLSPTGVLSYAAQAAGAQALFVVMVLREHDV